MPDPSTLCVAQCRLRAHFPIQTSHDELAQSEDEYNENAKCHIYCVDAICFDTGARLVREISRDRRCVVDGTRRQGSLRCSSRARCGSRERCPSSIQPRSVTHGRILSLSVQTKNRIGSPMRFFFECAKGLSRPFCAAARWGQHSTADRCPSWGRAEISSGQSRWRR